MAKKGITQHIPLVIWMDGKFTFPVNGKEIKFVGFPTGSGPAFFQGKWTMEDLQQIKWHNPVRKLYSMRRHAGLNPVILKSDTRCNSGSTE